MREYYADERNLSEFLGLLNDAFRNGFGKLLMNANSGEDLLEAVLSEPRVARQWKHAAARWLESLGIARSQ